MNMSEAETPVEVVPPVESSVAEPEVAEQQQQQPQEEVPVQQEECTEHVEELVDNAENEEPPPVVPACPKLSLLYGESAFPPRELGPGVPLSPFIACCSWPINPAKGKPSNFLHAVETKCTMVRT